MARYWFHLRGGTADVIDHEGNELENMAAVRDYALAAARDTLSNELKGGRLDLRYRIDAEDVSRQVIYSLPLADSFRLTPAAPA
jgi:hypothetical protein